MSDANSSPAAATQAKSPFKIKSGKLVLPATPARPAGYGPGGTAPVADTGKKTSPDGPRTRKRRAPPPVPNQVELLTLRQVGVHLQVCVKTVRRAIIRNAIPVVWVGNQMRVRADHLVLFCKKHR